MLTDIDWIEERCTHQFSFWFLEKQELKIKKINKKKKAE
jgi:hypothetical protein